MKERWKKNLGHLFKIVICIFLAYLFLPMVMHGMHTYFECGISACSALRIVSVPWLYHGRKITVIGFLRIQFEGNVLYPSQEAAKYPLTEDIWVDVTDEMKQRRDELNLNYVRITGTFNAMSYADTGLHAGTLEKIEKISIVLPRREYP